MSKNKEMQTPALERRYHAESAEFRKAADGTDEVFGYALKWGVVYDMGWFTEEIHRDALKNADLSDVRILFNHDPSLIVGRTKGGTAQVGQDDVGLWYRAQLPKSPNGENLRVALERGDVDQSSWGFYLNYKGDEWTVRDQKDHRIITNVRAVVDTSPVTYPANPDTEAAKRSKEMVEVLEGKQEEEQAPPETNEMAETYEAFNRAYSLTK